MRNRTLYILVILITLVLGNSNQVTAQDESYSQNIFLESFNLDDLSKKDCFQMDSILTISQDSLNDFDKIKYYTALYLGFLENNVPLMSITYINPLIPILEKSDDKSSLADLYSDKSLVHDFLAQYPQALTASHKSLALYIELGDESGEANSYNDIGILHYYNGNDSLSAIYHDRSFEIYKKLNDSSGLSMYYNNMANTLFEMEQYPNAIVMYAKARDLDIALGNKDGVAVALSNMGETYVLLGDYDKAEEILLEALELSEKTGDPWNITNPLRGLGELYRLTNQIPKAIKVLERSVKLSIEIDAIAEQSESYMLMYKLYKSTDNYKEALFYLEKYKTSNDSIFNQAKEQMSTEMEMKYQIQDKAKKIELLNSNKALDDLEHQQQISKQKNKVIYLVGGLVGFFIILIFAIRGFLLKKKPMTNLKNRILLFKLKIKK